MPNATTPKEKGQDQNEGRKSTAEPGRNNGEVKESQETNSKDPSAVEDILGGRVVYD